MSIINNKEFQKRVITLLECNNFTYNGGDIPDDIAFKVATLDLIMLIEQMEEDKVISNR